MRSINKFLRDDSGATGIEYGIIAMLISIAGIFGMGATGNEVGELYNSVADSFPSN